MQTNLEAIYNGVIVKKVEIEESYQGNIIIPDMGNETNEIGEVISVGPGSYSVMGELVPTQLKPGDKVILPTMGFTKLPFQGEEYYVGPENNILGKINQ
jgi:chaperonin GroES